jgi:hypothetical protein
MKCVKCIERLGKMPLYSMVLKNSACNEIQLWDPEVIVWYSEDDTMLHFAYVITGTY